MEAREEPALDDRQIVKQRIKTPLTDADLERHTGIKVGDVIKYSDLDNYKDITDLLPTDKSSKVILIEEKFNSGHWVCIMPYGKTIEFFNSYGGKWDTDWRFINKMTRLILGQERNELTRLMDKAKKEGWETVFNSQRFQKLDGKIQTCGRWCVFRIEMMKMSYTLKEFQDFVNKQVKEQGEKPDFLVSKWVF
jgi:hypothetical protein